jgi:hypothetical protein
MYPTKTINTVRVGITLQQSQNNTKGLKIKVQKAEFEIFGMSGIDGITYK